MNNGKKAYMVSIVMPVYNAEQFLSSSIGDILAQTFKDFELICVDDGSTDASADILDEYAVSDQRVRVIHQENQGGGTARNVGLEAATGKYLLFLDSDDRFEPDLVDACVKKAEESHCEVLAYDGDTFDHLTGEHRAAPWLLRGSADVIGDNPFEILNTSVWNKMFLREHVQNYKIRFQLNRIVDTMYFSFMNIIYAKNISLLRKQLIHYRINNHASILSNSDRFPTEAFLAFKSIKEKMDSDGIFNSKKNIFKVYAAEYLTTRLRLMRTAEGFSSLYNTLHEGGLEELGFNSSHESEAGKFNREIEAIIKYNENTFLFGQKRQMVDSGLIRRDSYRLPKCVKTDNPCKVVIYGAGNVGRDYFMQAMQRPNWQVIAWVDKKYHSIGYPLCSPSVLKETEYDFVVIAVLEEKVSKSIQADLEKLGVDAKKIFWQEPAIF